jgi:hypothetical protein
MASVWRMRDARGAEWFLKRHRDRERFSAELTAYKMWAPALHGKAARLRAFDEPLQAMILSALPGEPARWPAVHAGQPSAEHAGEIATHREAGAILRSLHDAQSALRRPDFSAAKIEQFDGLRPALSGLLSRRALDAARREIAALADIRAPEQVPCHHD